MPAPTTNTLIDVVNKRDEEVGTVRRGDALEQGQNFRTSHVFVLNSDGCLLLQRLAPQRDRHPGRWGSSVAAYLFAGESYYEGAARRMREELGLSADLEYLGKIKMRDIDSLKFVSLFLVRSDSAEIREPDHISQLDYRQVEEIAEHLDERPEDFTPTFVKLFGAFGDKLR
ncbi:MAG TPA: NUDIX domain-containing protein [Solirubrobacterales bacterium]|nr:NUDIX domain-containing protein [Solirubrobacterales bacterium]